jgi:hypothetical protein
VLWRKYLEPEGLVELAQKALAKVEEEFAQPTYFDWDARQENLQWGKFYRSVNTVTGCEYEATGYLDLKQPNKARPAFTRMEDELQTLKAAAEDQVDFKKDYTGRLATWWALMARTAELEGHYQDVMAYYEHALLSRHRGATDAGDRAPGRGGRQCPPGMGQARRQQRRLATMVRAASQYLGYAVDAYMDGGQRTLARLRTYRFKSKEMVPGVVEA